MLRRAFGILALSLCSSFATAQGAVTLLDVDVTAAVTAQVGSVFTLARLPADAPKYIASQAKFVYRAGGTTATAYVQTSLDGGVTWVDIMCFQFTTNTATKVSAVNSNIALAPGATPSDGSLTANTILNGLIGDRLRVKYTTAGTYTPTTATNTVLYEDGTAPTAAKVLNINGTVYTFVAIVAAAGDVKIEASADATMLNLSRCINKSGGTAGAGQDYMSAGGIAHPTASASLNSGTDLLTLTALTAGVGGNALTLSSTEATFTLGGALFSGGSVQARLKVTAVPR